MSESPQSSFNFARSSQYPITADGYDVYTEIGRGAFATVYQGRVKHTGEEIAIKIIDLDQFVTNATEIRREISTMTLLDHPHIVSIRASFIDNQELWIIMPLLRAGSCASIIRHCYSNGIKDETILATILYNTLQGLVYLHRDGRIHRDVKAGNILIGKHGEIQLADFGVASSLLERGDRQKVRQTFTGTPCWMAPEVMEQTSGYTEKADIWSFGITALELAYGFAPYAKFQPMKVMLLTLQEDPPTAEQCYDHFDPNTFTKHFHSMIAKCLKKEPSKRPSAKKLLDHKFFKLAKEKNSEYNSFIVNSVVNKIPDMKYGEPISDFRQQRALNNQQSKANDSNASTVMPGSWVFDMPSGNESDMANIREELALSLAKRPLRLSNLGGIDREEKEIDSADDYESQSHMTPTPRTGAAFSFPVSANSDNGNVSLSVATTATPLSSHPQSALPPTHPWSQRSSNNLSPHTHSHSLSLDQSFGQSLAASTPTIINSRKESRGRFEVTDQFILNDVPAPANNAIVGRHSGYIAGLETPSPSNPELAAFYSASAPTSQPTPLVEHYQSLSQPHSVSTPTLTHSVVGRFAVVDSVLDDSDTHSDNIAVQ